MRSKAFGLDIGGSSIKAVWLSSEKEGYILNAVISAPTPSKSILSEALADQQKLASEIRKIVADAKIDTRFVNIALPEDQVYTRVIEMPIISDSELSSAMYWEAEQYIPVPLSGITLDYTVLDRPAQAQSGNKMHVLLVGAPTALINKYQKVIALADLTISSIETEILATIRAVVTPVNFPTTLIINIGTVSSSMAIVRLGSAMFTYVIPIGGLSISRAIAADFGFTLQQAEEYKRVYGLSPDSLGGKIGKATEPILQSIISEIKKAIVFYQEKYKEDPIKQVLLSGGSAKLPGLAYYFTNALNIETAVANPWKNLATQEVPKNIIENASEYIVAVGLAMRDYE